MLTLLTLLTLGFPLLAFLLMGGLGTFLARKSAWISLFFTCLSLICAFVIASHYWDNPHHLSLPWFEAGHFQASAGLLLDKPALLMTGLVCLISLLVQGYSTAYMDGDKHYNRYFAYLMLFTFAMLGLVMADNLLLLYFFWELVGFASYLLIGFWGYKRRAAKAAQKAFLVNRIGDTLFLTGMLLCYLQFGSLQFDKLFNQVPDTFSYALIACCLLGGVLAKSAQFPMQTWLPDAMEGPTPVSAMLHAATMVAAGVFLAIRVLPVSVYYNGLVISMKQVSLTIPADTTLNSPLFDLSPLIALTCGLASLTLLLSAFSALFQTDIKKVLAYSTISQLGYMLLAIGLGAKELALFHLLTHAFFKACLFLSAGAVIHSLHLAAHSQHLHFDAQDMHLMGGLRKQMPITFACFLVSAFSLAGIPLFSGFLSKEPILMLAWEMAQKEGGFFYLLPLVSLTGTFLTACYVFRQLWLVFGGSGLRIGRQYPQLAGQVREVPWAMRLPMLVLAAASIFPWFAYNPLDAAEGWFIQSFSVQHLPHDPVVTLISLTLVGLAGGVIALYYRNPFPVPGAIRQLGLQHFYLDQFYDLSLIRIGQWLKGYMRWIDRKVIDKGLDQLAMGTVVLSHVLSWADKSIIDGLVRLTAWLSGKTGQFTRSIGNGRIQFYFSVLLLALLGLAIVMNG
jgi:NADH-quinone oxidoreductase subunit L